MRGYLQIVRKMVDLIGIAPTTSSMQRKRSRQMTPNWKVGHLQVAEKMVDLVGSSSTHCGRECAIAPPIEIAACGSLARTVPAPADATYWAFSPAARATKAVVLAWPLDPLSVCSLCLPKNVLLHFSRFQQEMKGYIAILWLAGLPRGLSCPMISLRGL